MAENKMIVNSPISIGELMDKISILKIKKTTKKKEIKINSNKKQKNKKVQNEKEEDIINTNEEEIAKIELIKEENEKSGWWSE